MGRNKPKKSSKTTPIDRRQRKGKQLLSPFAKLEDVAKWLSWKDDHLLNILWACILAGSLQRDHYLELFRRVAIAGRSKLKENKHASLCHNFLSTLEQEVFNDIFEPLVSDNRARALMQSITLIDGLPDVELWRHLFPNQGSTVDLRETLTRGVFACMDHQSQEATDVRWIKVVFMAICGRLILPASQDSTQKENVGEELRLYPNYGDMRKVRPTIRAIEMSIRSMEVGTEKGEYIPGFDSEIVWTELFRKSPCFVGTHEAPAAEDRSALVVELKNTIEQVIRHFRDSIATTNVDARMDSAFGIALYALTLTYELANVPSQLLASGRILLRTIAESFITLAFMRAKDDPNIWLQYRNYGTGQTTLAFLKASGLEEVPDYIDIERLEMLANEDAWMETRNINLGAWANKDLRKMSEEASVKEVYDSYYAWPSGFVHGHWGSIRDAVFTTCLNPLHRLHRVPNPMQLMPSVLADCCKLCNRILDELNTLYPEFNLRIQWHKEESGGESASPGTDE